MSRAACFSTTSGSVTCGTSRPGFRIRSRRWRRACEFLLVFDCGYFSENETFLVTDWFNHTPKEVLAKNFGVAESAFETFPTDIGHSRYMFAGDVPPAMADDAPRYPGEQPPRSFTRHMHAQEPTKTPGGRCESPTRGTSRSPSGSRRR